MTLQTQDLPSYGPVVPVIVIDELAQAVPLAQALVAGGVRVLEVTLRTPVALDALRAMAEAVPEAIVGAGTVRRPADLEAALKAGARFAVSPGLTPELARASQDLGLPLLPGVSTASEVMQACDLGFHFLKLFPAEAVGGLGLIKSLASPFADVGFCPTGGITPTSAPQYLAQPNVRCVGGSWLTPKDALLAGDWARITSLARQAGALRAA